MVKVTRGPEHESETDSRESQALRQGARACAALLGMCELSRLQKTRSQYLKAVRSSSAFNPMMLWVQFLPPRAPSQRCSPGVSEPRDA
eukprot:2949308-Prymnesium_polylepis.1